MDQEVGSWKMAIFPWSNFYGPILFLLLNFNIKNQFTKPLDLSLGGKLKYVSVERRAENEVRKILDLFDNFRGRVAYFRGF